MTNRAMTVVGLLVLCGSAVTADDALRLPITRDTWFSCVGNEANCNTGGAAKLKFKSFQEMSLLDFDPAPLKGRVIRRAALHLRAASSDYLKRVTVSTFAADWVEGAAATYAQQPGSSCFRMQRYPDVPWAFPGSDLTAVMLGQGGTFWRMADAAPPDKNGWQQIPVDPAVIAARAVGVSYGLLVFDDTGSEWTRQGEQFKPLHMPNRFAFSREAGAEKAPYLTVELGSADKEPPAAPSDIECVSTGVPGGEAMITWTTPADRGPAGTLGFLVEIDGKAAPRYLIPAAGQSGRQVTMHVRDLGLPPGGEAKVTVRAVDAAGNIGPEAASAVRLAPKVEEPGLVQLGEPRPILPGIRKLDQGMVAIIDELDKVHPVSGDIIPKQDPQYLGNNHFWCLAKEAVTIHMAGARNEWIGFQLVIRGPGKVARPSISFRDGLSVDARFARYRYVQTKLGPLPDPLEPMEDEMSIPAEDEKIEGQKFGSIHCEIYLPHDAAKGWHRGTIELKIDGQKWGMPLNLNVYDFTLPDEPSFLAEMNCYGLPANEMDYYRLAHENRTFLNRVPYNQRGEVAEGCGPKWDGKKLDFTEWDKRFGPLFDGTAFADSKRKGTPIEVFYLPMNENWPSTMREFYKDGYWADTTFKAGYREAFVEVSRQFAEHIRQKGWNQTIFQCFLNDKNNFKQNGWSRGSSPWLLDEPANWQDYWALRYFGDAFHEGVNKACPLGQPRPKFTFRCDISRPEWQRDAFDHVLDYNVVGGGAFRQYHRVVVDRKKAFGQIVLDYGTTNAVEDSNLQPVGWCWDSWTLDSDGVLPWQTIGNAESWQKGDELSLFYPGESIGRNGPLPSVRLKAYRRGQQDAEYLNLYSRATGQPRWAIRAALEKSLKLKAERKGTEFGGAEDAGRLDYKGLLPQHFAALRADLAQKIEAGKPADIGPASPLCTPPRDPSLAPPAYVAGWKPAEIALEESVAQPLPAPAAGSVIVLQGPEAVKDVLIDPDSGDKNFEGTARDNRLARRESCSAMLVRFDMDKAAIPQGKQVQKATVSFFVWDPASKGNTKVRAFGLTTPWNASQATWKSPAQGKTWAGRAGFAFGKDTLAGGPPIVVSPDTGGDTVDPPLEYRLDVTELARDWLSGKSANHGVAIAPEIDRSIDDGQFTRIQVLASEYGKKEFTPKLTLELR